MIQMARIVREDRGARSFLTMQAAENARLVHKKNDRYAPTPLHTMHNLAKRIGVADLHVKDESPRYGLNSFKILGAGYAMHNLLNEYAGEEKPTFVTATDGNHGRAVAYAARQAGCQAVVFMPEGSSLQRLQAIREEGAKAEILPMDYDEAVRYSAQKAKENGWIFLQDTVVEDDEEIARTVMQGYGTMAMEAIRSLPQPPTHVFLQVGVGSFAAAAAGVIADACDRLPMIVTVEPSAADGLYRTALANDGTLHAVPGPHRTIMAGLACGEINPLAWAVLRETASYAFSVPDWVAALGMRMLANAVGSDPRIFSGESGAAPAGLVFALQRYRAFAAMKEAIGLDADSRVLLFSTEGFTDCRMAESILWEGAYSVPEEIAQPDAGKGRE